MAVDSAVQPSLAPMSYGSLGARLGALIIDALLSFLLFLVAALLLRVLRLAGMWGAAVQQLSPEETWRRMQIGGKLFVLAGFALAQGFAYHVVFEYSKWQATFGKRLMGVHVTDDEGRRISLARSFGRTSAKWFLSWFCGSWVSLFTVLASVRKKALHDYLASTVVLNGRLPGKLESWRLLTAVAIPIAWVLGLYVLVLR